MLGPKHTELVSRLPMFAVVAVRTGAGKSPLSRYIAEDVARTGKRPAILRHPIPYGVFVRQSVQRFASEADLDLHECTVEEREEYEPCVELGLPVHAGELAESESDVVIWDGGNNDLSFEGGLTFVVADASRAGHEVSYHPGETNLAART